MVHGRLHGIARYALELARRLPALAPDWRFSALVPAGGLPAGLGALAPRISLHPSRAPFLSLLEQPLLLAELTRLSPDLFHATSFSLPLLWPGKLVATLHDANHLALPELYGPGRRAYYRLVVGPRARRASALLTVSDFSREELARHLGLSPYRLQVIAPGVDAGFAPPTAAQAQAFRAAHGLPARYLAVVGNPKPHKNLALLAQLAAEWPVPLVLLAGQGTREALGFPASTRELADLPEEQMPLFYGAATALLMPSRYEGFGLPALEALACGCPVVASTGSAVHEVTGSAAVLLPPDDEGAWREAVLHLLRDDAQRADLRARGLERAARFSWEDCARRTLAAYARALEAPARAP
ncbi:glycosyltransferase family 4 protein [Aggregicoccus sp. 17bor-14]|uniref:glycosyltransferase family 4 protein n=1 Tax=Myxococcaceae TaxID=31 RepID=UPI00129CD5C0|nr:MULTISPECIES: glycosyltransferase family 1 protein [Myxococcaceae]MBF5041293.1 glycosyltransferase family 4 protein [Simulacricoccus sp. 17bor-14]MRI87079.1 glycosyltransferase family 4 protein [Aggregicoccus sp. 17bor-14]